MNTVLNALKEFGLSQKEAEVYFAAVSTGTASITTIARAAQLKRPTAYLIIDALLQQGLLTAIPRGSVIHYQAVEPGILVTQLEEKKKAVLASLPELEKLYQESSYRPDIRFFEGKLRMMSLYEEVFRSKEVYGLLSVQAFSRVFSQDDEKHLFRLLERSGGQIYDMMENTKLSHEYANAGYRKGIGQVRFLKKGTQIQTDIAVNDSMVAIFSFPTVTAVAIHDPAIAATMRMMMQFMWQALPVPVE